MSSPLYIGPARTANNTRVLKAYEVEKPNCLSSLGHSGKDVRDHLTHFFGCIEYCERDLFFDPRDPEHIWGPWKGDDIDKEIERLNKQISVAMSISTQLKRIQVLRHAISNETLELTKTNEDTTANAEATGANGNAQGIEPRLGAAFHRLAAHVHAPRQNATGQTGEEPAASRSGVVKKKVTTNKVKDLVESHQKWRESPDFVDGVSKVKEYRKKKEKRLTDDLPPAADRRDWYSIEKALKQGDPAKDLAGKPISPAKDLTGSQSRPDGDAAVSQDQIDKDPAKKQSQSGEELAEKLCQPILAEKQSKIVELRQKLADLEEQIHDLQNGNFDFEQPPADTVGAPGPAEGDGQRPQEPKSGQDEAGTRPRPEPKIRIENYDLEKDVNAYVVNFQIQNRKDMPDKGWVSLQGKTLEHPHIRGSFPDQRIALKYLLEDKDGTVIRARRPAEKGEETVEEENEDGEGASKDEEPDEIRYIHVPSNNMHWVEEIMRNFYGDHNHDMNNTHETSKRTRTGMLLRPQFWRGQRHNGGSGIIHARHMRPICESVSEHVTKVEDVPKNIVAFMPYLHWETDRKRETVARMIDEQIKEERIQQEEAMLKESQERIKEWLPLDRALRSTRKSYMPPPPPPENKRSPEQQNAAKGTDKKSLSAPNQSLASFVMDMILSQRHPHQHEHQQKKQSWWRSGFQNNSGSNGRSKGKLEGIRIGEHGRILVDNPLGQFLLDAARLYEAMTDYRDKAMIRKYLFAEAPLHPRRTLDQAHFGTLKSTRVRDRDQVVYRNTTVDLSEVHRLKPLGSNKTGCGLGRQLGKFIGRSDDDSKLYWSCHDDHMDEGPGGHQKHDRLHGQEDKDGQPEAAGSGSGSGSGTGTGSGSGSGSGVSSGYAPDSGPSPAPVTASASPKHHRCEKCREHIRKVARVVMVDQLWMWILDERTIVTCFPRRYGVNKRDESGVHKSIRTRLKQARDFQFRSVYDLALVIIDECSNTFFDRTKTAENMPQVIDIFAEAIGHVTNQQTTSFQHVWYWTERASSIYRDTTKTAEMSAVHASLLDINPEGRLQREIKDIIEELDIMLHVKKKQQEVTRRLVKNVQYVLDPQGTTRRAMVQSLQSGLSPGDDHSAEVDLSETSLSRMKQTRNWQLLSWFELSAMDLQSEIADRIHELQNLKSSAESTAQSINDLLELKQQQASVVQAWQSVQQSEETVRQGRAIMMFTIVTIVFLPLSFMSSIFGMNNINFSGDNWTLASQFRLMFPISFGIIVAVIMLAFSDFVRTGLWCSWYVVTNMLFMWLQLYRLWLDRRDDWNTHTLHQRAKKLVAQQRRRVQRQWQERNQLRISRGRLAQDPRGMV